MLEQLAEALDPSAFVASPLAAFQRSGVIFWAPVLLLRIRACRCRKFGEPLFCSSKLDFYSGMANMALITWTPPRMVSQARDWTPMITCPYQTDPIEGGQFPESTGQCLGTLQNLYRRNHREQALNTKPSTLYWGKGHQNSILNRRP